VSDDRKKVGWEGTSDWEEDLRLRSNLFLQMPSATRRKLKPLCPRKLKFPALEVILQSKRNTFIKLQKLNCIIYQA
jgi:hypothetical protein